MAITVESAHLPMGAPAGRRGASPGIRKIVIPITAGTPMLADCPAATNDRVREPGNERTIPPRGDLPRHPAPGRRRGAGDAVVGAAVGAVLRQHHRGNA